MTAKLHCRLRLAATLPLVFLAAGMALAADKPGCADHPLFKTRMPGYSIAECKVTEFDAYDFWVVKGPKLRQEGKLTFITYRVDDRKLEPSPLAVARNYQAAVEQVGGKVAGVDGNSRWVNGTVVAGGRETWFQAEKGNGLIWLRIVDKAPMKQYIVADAKAMADDLGATGHTAIYGIHFDTGKADIKPESEAALAEIAKVLKADPALNLHVVGHTDNVGKLDANMKLSQARAEAVAQALSTKHGIAGARLKGHGVASLAPVASNDAEEGRAKNRRVELVKP